MQEKSAMWRIFVLSVNMALNMRIKNKDKIKSFNLDTLKLLVAQENAQDEIRGIRSAARGMPDGGFLSEKDFLNWYLPILSNYVDGNKEAVEIMKALYGGINKIIDDYGLTKDFFPPLWSYVGFNGMALRINGNVEISMTYPEKNEPLVITIEVFRKPSIKELEEIKSTIKEWSERHLPIHRKIKTFAKMDIDNALKIFSLMQKGGVHREKIYDSQYLEISKRQFERGKITKKELERREKINKDKVIVKKRKTTSKTVAKMVLGDSNKAPSARKTKERVEKEIQRRFKKV